MHSCSTTCYRHALKVVAFIQYFLEQCVNEALLGVVNSCRHSLIRYPSYCTIYLWAMRSCSIPWDSVAIQACTYCTLHTIYLWAMHSCSIPWDKVAIQACTYGAFHTIYLRAMRSCSIPWDSVAIQACTYGTLHTIYLWAMHSCSIPWDKVAIQACTYGAFIQYIFEQCVHAAFPGIVNSYRHALKCLHTVLYNITHSSTFIHHSL